MGKMMKCPYCNNNITYKVVYCYRGHNKRKENIDYDKLLKDRTIFREKGSYLEKYDFDGERITNRRYNKYCPNCKKFFNSIGNMSANDITNITLIGDNKNRIRLDININENKNVTYTFKKNYITLINNGCLNNINEILEVIKDYKSNYKNRKHELKNSDDYFLILKIKYYNGLSECYFNNDVINNFGGIITNSEKILNISFS